MHAQQGRSVSREELICESAGELLQPSLSRILSPERKERLAALARSSRSPSGPRWS